MFSKGIIFFYFFGMLFITK